MEFSAFSSQLSVLNTAGWEDTVLWNPYGNEGMGYNNFVCVESVKVSLRFLVARFIISKFLRHLIKCICTVQQFDPVTVGAGESWEGVMALKPGSL